MAKPLVKPQTTEIDPGCGAIFVNGDERATDKNLHALGGMRSAFQSIVMLAPLRDQILAEYTD